MRYYLIDSVTSVEIGKSATGVKCISLTDNVLHDHFPDVPILPGALITEGMAQLAGFLLECTFNKNPDTPALRAMLVQIDKMKFYKFSGPGDRLEYRIKIDQKIEDGARVSAEAYCEGERRVAGALTFSMVDPKSQKITQQRMDIYKIWTRNLSEVPLLR
ncbi:MAG: 3-hydroxyacyl-ACP dehydratase FabZ family protein [Bdellovibrionia bacterium]